MFLIYILYYTTLYTYTNVFAEFFGINNKKYDQEYAAKFAIAEAAS